MWELISEAALAVVFGVMSITDLKEKKVQPFWLLVPTAFGIINIAAKGRAAWVFPVSAIGILAALLFLSRITHGALGSGDAEAVSAAAFVSGPAVSAIVFFGAAVLAAVCGMVMLAFKKATKKTALPFYPFLTVVYLAFVLRRIGLWG